MSNMIPFKFETNEIRTIAENSEVWVVAKDVLAALEYSEESNPSRVISLVPKIWRGVKPIHTPGGTQQMAVLSEQGLYFFLGRSDKPKALPLQIWVAGEVLPSIRRTGNYSLPKTQPEPAVHTLPQQKATAILKTTVEAYTFLGAPLHIAQNEAVKYAHKETGVDYSPALAYSPAQDNIKAQEIMLEPTELGKLFGVSAQYINKVLARNGYQLKGRATWIPTFLGEKFCSKHAWRKGTKSGYNLKWKSSLLDRLLQVVDPEEVA